MKKLKLCSGLLAILIVVILLGRVVWQTAMKNVRGMAPLRVLVLAADADGAEGLHRIEMPIDRERALLQKFAESEKRKLEYVPVPAFADLFKYLKDGKGDLISANLSDTSQRKRDFLLSAPFDHTREMVFTSSALPPQESHAAMLAGRTGWLLPGTTYVENAANYAFCNPWFRCRILPESISHDALIEAVYRRKIDYSVLNEADLDAWLAYRTGIRKLFPIRSRVPLVFAARKDSVELMRKLNCFIQEQAALNVPQEAAEAVRIRKTVSKPAVPVSAPVSKPAVPVSAPISRPAVKTAAEKKTVSRLPAAVRKMLAKAVPLEIKRHEKLALDDGLLQQGNAADLPQIRKRGYIRMLTMNNFFGCYLKQGQLCGFEYELAKRFAESQNLRIVTVILENRADFTRYLAEGKGDFIAANFSRLPELLQAFPNLMFCAPYHGARHVLVGRKNEKIQTAGDLANRRIHVHKNCDFYVTLRRLQAQGMRFTIVPVPENERPMVAVKKVELGEYDLTVGTEDLLAFAVNGGFRVKKVMTLTEKLPFCWVVRKNNPRLASAVNAFFKKENRSTFFNLCVKRYYGENKAQMLMNWAQHGSPGKISPYDVLFQKYAGMYHFNWYFLAAQSFQESRFQPDQVNPIGATGLMQMMPRTAREMGISNLKKPENAIHAGTKYMAKMRSRFTEPAISPLDQLCFSLAAYNAGYGHVDDARLLAEQMGLNPYVWFNHTEKAMRCLEDPRYASKTKFGYCRASETIPYVNNIILQGIHYQKMQNVQKDAKEKFGPRRNP